MQTIINKYFVKLHDEGKKTICNYGAKKIKKMFGKDVVFQTIKNKWEDMKQSGYRDKYDFLKLYDDEIDFLIEYASELNESIFRVDGEDK